ncbi:MULTISPECIES: beta strand repeat-containing protein [unclassified Bradyrhizobium]|uniref:beta strand repeat-containing protein n=1 Tax=unclassified Bradyrhizobium TaxID=2631580 RepID=UPI00041B1AED|nr:MULTISPECIES: calcium-binding protein [unclassified Bradyrhizobium]QIG96265.1 calcium-binding protein [Bradyrhizobium sp. 6(2017)]
MGTFSGTSGNDTVTGTPNGSNTNDTLSGLGGNDTLIGGDGADSLDGGTGQDFASYIDSGTAVVASLANPAVNTGFAAGDTYTSIEGLIGSNFNDTLTGNGNTSYLQGGLGADSIIGGSANDYADYANASAGLEVDLADPTQNTGEATGDTYVNIAKIRGSAFNDTLIGDANGNTLRGGAGADVLNGGGGFDFASYSDSGVGITADLADSSQNTGEAAGDTYISIEGLRGSDFNDHLIGDGNINLLQGGLGADTLDGGAGFDYADYFNATSGVVADLANSSLNTGEAAGDVYISIEAIRGTAFNDTLIGDANTNFLRGGTGADSLDGGAGYDYADYGNATTGVLVNLANPAANTGEAAGDTFTSIEGIQGGAFNDTLIGDGGNNNLRGQAGADSLDGGAGFDFADYGNAATGVVASLATPGVNTGDAAGDTYTSIEGIIGSAFNDTLTGDGGDNNLRGGAGADVLDGGAGNDVAEYVNATVGVLASLANPASNTGEAAGDTYTSIEGLRGSNFNDTLIGDGGDNLLDGIGGADSLVGGLGNDIYILDNALDVITENPGEGIDTAVVTGAFNYTLAANVDNLAISTSANVSGTGNGLANFMTGGSGNNTLDGGIGADTMAGGLGNDTYYVDNAGDVVTENSGEGTDTVHTTITYGLTANVENLILDGSGNLTGSGNALNNVLTGNAGNNSLYGNDGNDTAYGGAGADVLVLGNGDDYGDAGDGNDYIYAGAGNDVLIGGTGLDVLLGEDGNDVMYGGAGFNYLFGGAGTDTLIGSGGTGGSDVNVMFGGDGTDFLYGGNSTNYFYGGTGVDTMYGGSGLNIFISSGETDGNLIYGGSGQNYVYGSNGGDTVTGGSGVDVFLMGTGADNISGGGGVDYAWGGGGADTFNISDTSQEVMVVQDFNTGGVNDFVNFAGTSLHSFADVQAAETYVAGINTTIITDAAGSAVWLIGVAPGQLDASMFKFS